MMPEHIEPHPIRELIEHLLSDGDPGEERIVLRNEARALLEQAIDAYAKACTPELMLVAQTVFSIADWLEAQRCTGTAEALCAVLDRAHVLSAMQVLNERVRTERGTLEIGTPGDAFASFESRDTGRRAPAFHATTPVNAVKAGSLDFPKRL